MIRLISSNPGISARPVTFRMRLQSDSFQLASRFYFECHIWWRFMLRERRSFMRGRFFTRATVSCPQGFTREPGIADNRVIRKILISETLPMPAAQMAVLCA